MILFIILLIGGAFMNNKNTKNKERKEDLNLTMQQKFNFDSNKFDEENTKTYKQSKSNISKSKANKRIKEIIKMKNKYKLKYRIFLSLFIITFFVCLGMVIIYLHREQQQIVEKKIIEKTIIPENIVFLGDSITQLYDLDAYYGTDRYVVNSGISGNTTDDILNDMKNRVYVYNPSKVFILIGTNDIDKNKSKDEIVNNIKKIVNSIRKNRPYCKIYLESIYPINNSDDKQINHNMVGIRDNETIKEINMKLKQFAKEQNITYIDMYQKLEDSEGNLKLEYTTEGLHISKEGYKIITEELKKYL